MTNNSDLAAETTNPASNAATLRPQSLDDFIGQTRIKPTLRMLLDAAKIEKKPLGHLCFFGEKGLGKTSLAYVVRQEVQAPAFFETSGSVITRPGDAAALFSGIRAPGAIIFVDEIHAIPSGVQEMFLKAMEDFIVSIPLGKDNDKHVTLNVPPFTLLGATTDYGKLSGPMRDRFLQHFFLQPYTLEESVKIAVRAFDKLEIFTDAEAANEIARRSHGTPRLVVRYVHLCHKTALVSGIEVVDVDLVRHVMDQLYVDSAGLTDLERNYLATLVLRLKGGPVSSKSISASSGLDKATIEEVIEPILLRTGFIVRTQRGRRITREGYDHIAQFVSAPPIRWSVLEKADEEVDSQPQLQEAQP